MYSKRKKVTLIFIVLIFVLFFPFLREHLRLSLLTSDIDDAFSFSLENGFYEGDISVELSLSSTHLRRMRIYYTLDGSNPDTSSPLYDKPLSFSSEDKIKAVTVKAIVCDENQYVIGGPYTATYIIGKNVSTWSNALVVSITSDPSGLYSQENGILYPMADCGPTEEDWSWFKKQNCKQRGDAWIRQAYVDVFEPDGTNVISQGIGLCVDGDHGSMTHYPYSLKVLAGKEYDSAQPDFTYDVFRYYNTKGTEFSHIQNFNNMVFRNGGNEYNAGAADPEQRGTMLRWSIGSRLADEAGYMTAGSRPAIIFLNGELYSVACLQDTYNRHNTAAKTLLNKDQLEIYKSSERACTQKGGYEELYYSYPDIENSPILLAENQKAFEQTVSLEDMFSYYAFEVLINNTDYPKKNYAIWRYNGDSSEQPYSDGKWRFLINDLDCTYDFRYDDDLWTAYFDNIKEDGTLMGSVIQVEKYKAQFINILCDLMNSGLFDQEHLDTVINEANNDFGLIASHYYTPEDEAKRQQNVALLKESAFARKEKVRGFLEETFTPAFPYALSVKAPRSGSSIRFSTTELTSSDGDFEGQYYGDYPMTLSASCNQYRKFSCWKINGEKVASPEITLDASLIRDGTITVELETIPAGGDEGLIISELCADGENSWIELYNTSDHELNLGEYALSNKVPVRYVKFNLPEITLAPGEVFVAGIDNAGVFQIEAGNILYLVKDRYVIDHISVPLMARTESYGRYGETNEWRYYVKPTKGTVN
ncbi:MAG: CotH kinase family protein [Lachnospiraceae bacterium]|nr:CotH kinase family protein [Lachnospiraceae bacterium]